MSNDKATPFFKDKYSLIQHECTDVQTTDFNVKASVIPPVPRSINFIILVNNS